ncbi:20S-pre-rRNA D-site endonuclease nob1 [Massospora cicadina]|nr:20S-pre-rRNA D-site endonuclease nob1 [Massospora cicadina]
MGSVVAFSKKTGDYATLSSVDLKVLALTYMVEKENCGVEHLRTEPVKPQVQQGGGQHHFVPKDVLPKDGNAKNTLAESQAPVTATNSTEVGDESAPAEQEEEDDSDDGEWITPQNLKLKQLESLGHLKKGDDKDEVRKVGCITTDYAMQSVILQMNLALVSVEGLMVKYLKSFVLRCHACYKVTTNLTKQFCPSCGGPTLIRTSCSVDENGTVKYYLKKNFRYNLRGIRYSIPTPKGGHVNSDLILREDTKEYQRALKNYFHRKETNLFDPDYLPGILTGKHAASNRPPTIGYGRRNPNQARRCKGRKKS